MRKLLEILNDPKKKLIYFLAFVFILFNVWYNLYEVRAINQAMLDEKYTDIKKGIDMICEAASEESGLIAAVEFLDAVPFVFAAVYTQTLEVISERYFVSDFDPLIYPELIQAIEKNDSGALTVHYAPDDMEPHDLRLCFRRTGEFIIIAGVSKYSVSTAVPVLFSAGQWLSTAIVSALFVIFVFMDAMLGYVWVQRGEKKWRNNVNLTSNGGV